MKLIKNILGKIIRITYRLVYRFIPSDKQTILFISFHGRGYSDNPKALHQYITNHREYQNYRCIFAIKHHRQKNLTIPNAKIIEYFSIPYFFYLARSKYWIANCKLPKYVLKKKDQIYLQTWHGTPLKKLAHDIEVPEGTTFYRSEMSVEEMRSTYDNDVSKYTYMISPSSFTTEVFQSAFAINKERLIETGYPRNDILSNYHQEEIQKIKADLNLPDDKKIILYAPTWRDNSYNLKGYTFKLEVDFKKWQEALGNEYIVVFKPHYLIINDFDLDSVKDFVYYIDPQADISSLYLIADILVTDYSSVFFDYAILNRPIYFYMYDLDSYRDELRGFYLDIYQDLPGAIIEDENELLTALANNDYDYSRLTAFNQRFNNHEDGNASKRVIDILFKQVR
ncbi:CDP-glycerol glycerophosphotransferase family protein [Thomasclavelia sp.]|uniref:CDP-glycerol glycerophosphotransferase family protein n=1 Tax=Thomasclavelia sp. TaxID=3025757 RepID=UPI0025F5278D|nr:CDP-glycerol glycerophosphotransferase family protein [Thomasclavelia sp.]